MFMNSYFKVSAMTICSFILVKLVQWMMFEKYEPQCTSGHLWVEMFGVQSIKMYVKLTWVDLLLSGMSKYATISIEMAYNVI